MDIINSVYAFRNVRMCTCLWQPSTMMSFCCGEVLANTISVWFFSTSSIWSCERSFRSDPWITQALASLRTQVENGFNFFPRMETRKISYQYDKRLCWQARILIHRWLSFHIFTYDYMSRLYYLPSQCFYTLPGVDLTDRNIKPSGDVFHCLVSLRDDADALSDGLGRDWMVTGHHNDFDTGWAAFAHGVGYGGPRRVDHRHQTHEAQVICLEVDVIRVKGESFGVFVIGQKQVAESWMEQIQLKD